jgi:SanA protein
LAIFIVILENMLRKLSRIMVGLIGLALTVLIVLNVYVYEKGEAYIIGPIENIPHAEAAIILGAAVSEKGIPSSVLKDRVMAAIDLYKRGKVLKILMSGGNPTVTNNEVDPIRKILIASGINKKKEV